MLSSYEEELRKSRKTKRENGRDREEEYFPHSYNKSLDPGLGHSHEGTPITDIHRPDNNRDKEGAGPTETKERKDEPYLTFPGYQYSYPTSSPYGAETQPRPPPWAGPGVPPSYYPPYYPPSFPRPPMDSFGVAAMTLGIVAMCIFWLSVLPFGYYGTILFVVVICITSLGIIFGGYSYANRRRRSIHGLVGLILSIIATILSAIIWSVTHIPYIY
jgi:hypothetical protein